jgi:SpoVK/Ycf46/Vps4 family AAA+-type ATPase
VSAFDNERAAGRPGVPDDAERALEIARRIEDRWPLPDPTDRDTVSNDMRALVHEAARALRKFAGLR